jgi:hypothetical protein
MQLGTHYIYILYINCHIKLSTVHTIYILLLSCKTQYILYIMLLSYTTQYMLYNGPGVA